ncbi:hypothetical protein A2V82_06660 [candidate division KSB1 bacterium RBG_16_48_16]|nr:MAG: hypothetical protein A2V82_06660 [candidate division KSB1 bacterium RBG_16_48_16]
MLKQATRDLFMNLASLFKPMETLERIKIASVVPDNEVKDMTTQKVSVIVALKNQAEQLPELNIDLQTTFRQFGRDFEIIYVDDGSTDRTWRELLELARGWNNIKLVKLRTTFGESSVLDAGRNLACGEYIIYFTCRVNINPKDLGKLLEKIMGGADVVVGVRHPRRDSRLNQLVSKVFNAMTNHFAKLGLSDINSGVIGVRRSVLEHVPFYGALNAFIPVMARRQGYRVEEEQVEQLQGRFNQSLYPKDYIRRFLDLISVLFLSNYSKKPLHFLGFAGALFAILGAAINIYLFFYRILGIGGIAGKPMLLLGTLLLIIGIQMISIGLLGEIIIFTHAKDIQEYNIEEIIE